MAERIQRRRVRGWRLPENARVVCRPGDFGNPFVSLGAHPAARRVAVEQFREWIANPSPTRWRARRRILLSRLHELVGFDLCCWCALPAEGEPDFCHAVVLLEMVADLERKGAAA